MDGLKDIMKRLAVRRDPNNHLSMLDYADFNAQHSPLAQSILFERFAHEGELIHCHPDWILANDWLAKAKFAMRVNCPCPAAGTRPAVWGVKQGLLSGTKGTHLINTLLNVSYFNIAHDLLYEITGYRLPDLLNIHQGDDI